MKSGAINHFPQVVIHRGRRALWNPISRQPLVNRPEERVRLRFIDFLTLDCRWPLSRISIEQPLGQASQRGRQRADIICYSRDFQPDLLIECKAESVALNESAARQIALYNRQVGAPLICLTNGARDFWYRLTHRVSRTGLEPLSDLPHELTAADRTGAERSERAQGADFRIARPDRSAQGADNHITGGMNTMKADASGGTQSGDKNASDGATAPWRGDIRYWHRRGFTGKALPVVDEGWLPEVLSRFWYGELPGQIRYLAIDDTLDGLDFSHYYNVFETGERSRIAASFMPNRAGHTCMTAILNLEGENRGVLIADLNRAAQRLDGSCTLYMQGQTHSTDLLKHLPIPLHSSSSERSETDPLPMAWLTDLPHHLTDLFKRYL